MGREDIEMKHRLVLVLLILLLGAATLVNAQSSPQLSHVGRQPAEIILTNHYDVGDLEFWNTRFNFMVDMQLADDWLVHEVQLYAGKELPPTEESNGKPLIDEFNCIRKYRYPKQR